MKNKHTIIGALSVVVLMLLLPSCSGYDDTGIRSDLAALESRVTTLETLCDQMNSNISALQAAVVALQNKEYVESINPLPDNQGYTFSFSSGRTVTVYNGKDGKNGTDGKDGENGRDGVDGKDGVTPVIGVRQDTDGVWYWTLNGDWLYADGKRVKAVGSDGADGKDGVDGTDGKPGSDGKDGKPGADGKDGVTPKLKIEEGMWYVSCDDGVSWEQLGKATGDDGADAGIISVTEDNGYVHFGMSDGTVITIAKRMPLTISFDSEDVAITTGGASRTIGYTLTGASEKVVVKTLTQDGWKAKVNQKSSASGTIEITAPNPLVESEILVFVSDGGQTALAAINCVKATIVISQEKYEVDAAGGNIDVTAQTNTEFQVSIPDDAKSWLSYVPTKSMATKAFNLSAAANDNAFRRNAVVSLTDDSGNVIRSFVVSQAGDMSGLISIQCDVKGDLHSILEAYDKENIVKMKISGVLNDVDFLDIYYEMPALRYLDISDVNIDALPKSCFAKSRNVRTIILPKTLETIPDDCFRESKISGELVIPASCEAIGKSAFENCTSLMSIIIMASCKTIGTAAFVDCSSLESVVFESGSQLKTIGGNGYYKSGSFCGCTALKSITIPASCEEIGGGAFDSCNSLESVVFELGSRLKIIDGGKVDGAFSYCTALKSITIPASCETIGCLAFKGCVALEQVNFEAGTQLKIIDGGFNLTTDYGSFCNCIKLKSITIPSSCENIGPSAFKNCESLERVEFAANSSLKKIGGGFGVSNSVLDPSSIACGAFSNCISLKSIIIPRSCEEIGVAAFKNCRSLERIEFETNSRLRIIKGGWYFKFSDRHSISNYYGAFSDCVSLVSIIIPASCEIIEASSFQNCNLLRYVRIESGSQLKTIAGGSAYGESSGQIYVEAHYYGAFFGCSSLESFSVPSSVVEIGDSAFMNCSSLSELSFEDCSELKTIDDRAFTNCGFLRRIDMRNCSKLTSIGVSALDGTVDTQTYLFQIGTTIPPVLGSFALNLYKNSVLKVPAGSESAYKKASGWREFSSITAID